MRNYADYQFYSDDYKGSLSDDLFSSFIVKASRTIDRNVNCDLTDEVLDQLTETEDYKLKYTACLLCDIEQVKSSNSKVNSISIDGVSKTLKSNDDIKKVEVSALENLPIKLTRFI